MKKILICFLLSISAAYSTASYCEITPVVATAEDGSAYSGVRITFSHTNPKDGIERHYVLRNLEDTTRDLGFLCDMFGDPTTMARYMTGNPRPASEVQRRFNKYIGWWKNSPWSNYILLEINDDQKEEFRGHVMIEPSDREANLAEGVEEHPRFHTEAELSYILLAQYWGQGLGGAAVNALVQQWVIPQLSPSFPLNGHNITSLYATALDANEASWKLLLHNGFQRVLTKSKFGNSRGFYELSLTHAPLAPVTAGYWQDQL